MPLQSGLPQLICVGNTCQAVLLPFRLPTLEALQRTGAAHNCCTTFAAEVPE